MKDLTLIKEELQLFFCKYNYNLKSIKGNSLTELFDNIGKHISWYKETQEKTIEFNAIFENQLVIENGILLCNCSNDVTIVIPKGVVTIGCCSFKKSIELKSVIISDSVTEIKDYAFCDCTELKSVIIPDSVTELGYGAFKNCKSLKSVIIPDSVTFLGESVFTFCRGLTSIKLSENQRSIERYSFSGCSKLTSITIPHSVKAIGYHAFKFCNSLQSVTIKNSCVALEDGVFDNTLEIKLTRKNKSVRNIKKH